MQLKTVKISDLKPHSGNPNTHPSEQLTELRNSLDQFDQVKNIVVWQGQVIAGNGLLEAAKYQNRKTIEVQDVSDWPEEKAIKYMISDNRLAEMAIMDDDLLSGLLLDFDEPLDIPGIDEVFLDSLDLDDGLGGESDKDPDEVPEVVEPVVKSGELWLLGKHRLLCSDSTKKENVERLLDGKEASLCLTDPPYEIETKGGGILKKSSAMKGIRNLKIDSFSPESLSKLSKTSIYCCNKPLIKEYILLAEKWEVPWDLCIYHKQNTVPNYGGHMMTDLEYLFIIGDQSPETGIGQNKEMYSKLFSGGKDTDNKTAWSKPVELFSKFIRLYAKGGIVVDPYLGSGTTLIACEQTNRICYGMEIDPHYCDVILQRWADYTGKDPIREDGIKFSELKNK